MAADAGELKARATLDNTEFLSSLKDMVNQIQQNSANAAGGIDKIGESFKTMAEAAGALEIAKQIEEFAGDCIDAALQVAKLKVQFDLLAGSQEASNQAFEDLKALGLNSVFSFADTLGPAAENMMKLGLSTDQTTATMHALVDAASAMKEGPGWITAVSDTIDAMQGKLVATARDMKSFEVEGIDAWGALATQLGVSVSDAEAMVKAGMVTAQQVTEAVTTQMNEQFQGSASLAGTTWAGAMKILENSGEEAKESIGNSILAVLNDFAPVLMNLSALIQDATKWWDGLSTPIKTVVLAFGAALPIVAAIVTALPLLEAGLGAVAAAFAGPLLPITALIAALALIGKWVYDEWPAIKAVFLQLWDDIKFAWTALWTDLSTWFGSTFGVVAETISGTWNGIKTVIGGVIDLLVGMFQNFVGAVGIVLNALGGLASAIPGVSETVKSLTAAWSQGQQAIAANKAAVDAHTASVKANAQAQTANVLAQKQKEAADLAASKAAQAAAADQAKADAAAQKAAQEQQQINESLNKTYLALYAVAPSVAQQFSDMYGGIATDALTAQKTVGKAWDDMDAATQQLVTDTLALGAAYKDLGVTSVTSLQGAADKAAAAYTTISNSGTATAGDLTKAFDAVVASQQKVADQLNNDVKEAYTKGEISADSYYATIITRAQASYDATVAANDGSVASQTKMAAAWTVLQGDISAAAAQGQKDYSDAMTAIGEQTQTQLDDASTKWTNYAATIATQLGTNSKQYIEASIQETQALMAEAKNLNEQTSFDALQTKLQALQDQLEGMKTPAEQFADDMKKLGIDTTQDIITGVTHLATALADAKAKSDGSLQSTTDLDLGTQKLDKSVQDLVDTYNNKWQAALKAGDITQAQYNQHAVDDAAAVLAQFTSLGDTAPGKIQLVNAATHDLDVALHNMAVGSLKDNNDAFTTLGVNSQSQLDAMKTKAVTDFGIVASQSSTDSLTYMDAWINATKLIYKAQTEDGTSLSSAQKEDLAKMEQKRDDYLTTNTSAWTTAYKTVSTDIGNTFDALTQQIVTGDLSFGKLFTKLWQDLADAALNAFLAPLKTAITKFISTELANLLGDQGLGGVLSSLTKIGTQSASLFGSGASTVSTAGGDYMNQIGGAASSAGGAASSAGGAASNIGGALSSAVPIIGAVGSVVSAVAGIVGDVQTVHTQAILNSIEHNTRYTMMYVGDRADGGILGILFKIDEEIAWGANTKATENHRDLFKDWSNPMLAYTQGINDILGSWAPYIGDMKDALFDIRDSVKDLVSAVTSGFQGLTVTINAGNLTTADAARALGNQIAANLATQLVAIKG